MIEVVFWPDFFFFDEQKKTRLFCSGAAVSKKRARNKTLWLRQLAGTCFFFLFPQHQDLKHDIWFT